jgi:germination protein M
MSGRLLLAILAALLLAALCLTACGGGDRSAATTTTTPEQPPQRVVAYFYRDGKLAPVVRRLQASGGAAATALRALAAGPPDGYATALPSDASLRVAGVENGHAKLDVEGDLDTRADAQTIFTLTRLPTIDDVAYDGLVDPATGRETRKGLDRAAFVDLAPPILVESPLPDERVASPVHVRGTARVFEATLVVELEQNGHAVAKKTVTASTGAPETGTFATTLDGGRPGPARVVAWSPSAADGSRQHLVSVPVEITP